MYTRTLIPRNNYSFFLFGPRGVGKSTLLRTLLDVDKTHYFDLLNLELEHQLLRRPQDFSEMLDGLSPQIEWVVVDEIQKIPELLNEVHRQIEKNKKRFFALTGSSARKLRHGKANLLAGRAFTYDLYPLTFQELGKSFQLDKVLQFGSLPKIFSFQENEDKNLFLSSYAQTYLKEEIQAEALVRDLQSFHRFLPLAAHANGELLSWSSFALDVGVDAKTIRSYFEILEDTLLGFILPAYLRSLRKRQKTSPKFYFFDTGVKRALAGELSMPLLPGSREYGRAFEHGMILEILRQNSYRRTDYRFSYFATHDIEIDLVIEKPSGEIIFIEFKSSENVKEIELRPLKTLMEEVKQSKAFCFCREKQSRKVGNVWVLPYQQYEEIFSTFPSSTSKNL